MDSCPAGLGSYGDSVATEIVWGVRFAFHCRLIDVIRIRVWDQILDHVQTPLLGTIPEREIADEVLEVFGKARRA